MRHTALPIICSIAAAIVLGSCNNQPHWTVSGTIHGGESKQLVIERPTYVGWNALDTVQLDGKGNFSYKGECIDYPDIFRATIDGHTLYFPVDSTESIRLEGTLPGLEGNYTISGTDDGIMLRKADSLITESVERLGIESAKTDPQLKRRLAQLIIEKPHSIVAYYIINKSIGGTPLYNPHDRNDLRIVGAVANSFDRERPGDPHTAQLRNLFLSARRNRDIASGDTVIANSISFHDIRLFDRNGKEQNLSDVAYENRIVLLNFTNYSAKESPAFNIELNKAYAQLKSHGVEIYQVAIDSDEPSWREAAANLPWVAVRNAGVEAGRNLLYYNVQTLPTSFIIKDGELVERLDISEKVATAIGRHL